MALTCFIGNSKIISTNHAKEELRRWSDKGILKCDCCDTKMIYKHGDFKTPHFAHITSNCGLEYNEPESDEHINGKLTIYNWLMSQNVQNLELESWIPETKQRPDIYFEKDGKRFVIEFQCTPIATEFNERRKLYRLAGIIDIWILGFDKFDFNRDENQGEYFGHIFRYDTKAFERELLQNDKKVFHMTNNKIIPFLEQYHEMVTDVIRYSFDTCAIDIFDLRVEDFLDGKYFKDTISINKITRNNMIKMSDGFKKLMVLKKKDILLTSIRATMKNSNYDEVEELDFKKANTSVKFKLFDSNKLIENKTHSTNIACGNYIVAEKIVTITNTEKKVFWNYNKKKRRKIPTEAWFLDKVIQSVYDFDVSLLYFN